MRTKRRAAEAEVPETENSRMGEEPEDAREGFGLGDPVPPDWSEIQGFLDHGDRMSSAYYGRGDKGHASQRRGSKEPPRLFTATICYTGGNTMIQAFHTSIARDAREIAYRMVRRFGLAIAANADIRRGFHPANPVVIALVPSAVAAVIRSVEARALATGDLGFAVDIEQRIEA